MAVTSDLDKRLSIKMNVVKRYTKEILMYKKEVAQQNERITALQAEDACAHDISKQDEVLQETLQMIPDCEQRLVSAKEDLSKFMNGTGGLDPQLLIDAKTLL